MEIRKAEKVEGNVEPTEDKRSSCDNKTK